MRAVIRCDVQGRGVEVLRRQYQSNDPAYQAAIVELFEGVGLKPISKLPSIGPEDSLVSGVFDHVPSDTKDEELKRIVLTGYTSERQANFVVRAIHHDRLRVRTHADTFLRLSKSCAGLHGKLPSAAERLWRYSRGLTSMKLDPLIHVLEPRQEVPTIMGKAIRRTLFNVAERERYANAA